MKTRHGKTLCAIVMVLIIGINVAYGEPQDALKPLLIDLDGWSAADAEGMSMDMGTMKLVNAMREYEKGAENLTAMVMIGNQMMAQGQMQQMNMETDMGKVKITTIDGFKVHTSYDKAEKSGAVIVFLSQVKDNSGIFTCYFEGLSEEDALKAAKRFDWNKMKAATEKLMEK
jgi:hypothetical protein